MDASAGCRSLRNELIEAAQQAPPVDHEAFTELVGDGAATQLESNP